MRFHGWVFLLVLCGSLCSADDRERWQAEVTRLTAAIEKSPQSENLYSLRGDMRFFLGQFSESAADYDKMVQLNPGLDAEHWRRGIAWFYAGEYEKAAGQFERYHSFDNVDRENGIWRYLCQRKAVGQEKARAGLLKYEKDDREPFGDVYKLFQGTVTAEALLEKIRKAEISDNERQKRLFYAELYVGLNEAVENRPEAAQKHLRAAADNPWPVDAGYGPQYMLQVARVHAEQLEKAAAKATSPPQ